MAEVDVDPYETLQDNLTAAFEEYKEQAVAQKQEALAEYGLADFPLLKFEDKKRFRLAAPEARALALKGGADDYINGFLGMPFSVDLKGKKSGYVCDRFGIIRKVYLTKDEEPKQVYKFYGVTIELGEHELGFYGTHTVLAQTKERLQKLRKTTDECDQLFAGNKCGKKICKALKSRKRTGC
jgi:hypothetical protein